MTGPDENGGAEQAWTAPTQYYPQQPAAPTAYQPHYEPAAPDGPRLGYLPPPPYVAAYQPPHQQPYYRPVARPATTSAPLRNVLAHMVLWLGLAAAVVVTVSVDWFSTSSGHYDPSGLNLGYNAGPRIAELVVLSVPFALAVLILPAQAGRRLVALIALVLAAVVTYAFSYNDGSATWLVYVVTDVILLAGWLIVRDRPGRSFALLVVAAGVSALWWMPGDPGLWLRLIPRRLHLGRDFSQEWLNADLVLMGLVGLLAFAVGRTARRTTTPAPQWQTWAGQQPYAAPPQAGWPPAGSPYLDPGRS